MSAKALKFRAVPPPPPLREMSNEELINSISIRVRFAMGNLDECAGAILLLMDLRKKYPGELPEFTSISGAWRNLNEARRAVEVLRYNIVHKK